MPGDHETAWNKDSPCRGSTLDQRLDVFASSPGAPGPEHGAVLLSAHPWPVTWGPTGTRSSDTESVHGPAAQGRDLESLCQPCGDVLDQKHTWRVPESALSTLCHGHQVTKPVRSPPAGGSSPSGRTWRIAELQAWPQLQDRLQGAHSPPPSITSSAIRTPEH